MRYWRGGRMPELEDMATIALCHGDRFGINAAFSTGLGDRGDALPKTWSSRDFRIPKRTIVIMSQYVIHRG